MRTIRPSAGLANVKYEIRGDLARRAYEMERLGYEIVPLNIGNPGVFGFRTPETMRLAMIENLKASEAYCHQKGIFPAREAVVMQQQSRGVRGVSADGLRRVMQIERDILQSLKAELDEYLVKSNGSYDYQGMGDESDSPARAVRLVSGRVFGRR